MTTWNKVCGTLNVEYICDEEGRWTTEDGVPIPSDVAAHLGSRPDDGVTVTIHFTSSGYYDGGRFGGPADDCYPPEGEDDRRLMMVTIDGIGRLPDLVGLEIYRHHLNEVEEAEL